METRLSSSKKLRTARVWPALRGTATGPACRRRVRCPALDAVVVGHAAGQELEAGTVLVRQENFGEHDLDEQEGPACRAVR